MAIAHARQSKCIAVPQRLPSQPCVMIGHALLSLEPNLGWSSSTYAFRDTPCGLCGTSSNSASTVCLPPSKHWVLPLYGYTEVMVATCGFDSRGTARVAAPDYDCRVDARNGIWGFCPSSVINAWDCGLAGYCVDQHDCSDGCGPLKDRDDITTFTW
jgi:hypothetical protein